MKYINAYLFIIFSFLVFSCKNATTFELLSSDDTGIHFSNKIVENDSLSILKYEYLYNGSGVGMGDFNNDGLLDIIFSGSQANATLYLNKGEMKFEELGKAAGLVTKDRWCSG
ncbi:MAG: VCBS repeat-containing protein, partial [Cytophagales bacterium]|nr:VCBS repeat-containing protein [Cytophagales bacterium]